MPDDESPLHAFFDLLGREARELLPVCRWLLLGPWLADGFFRESTRAPTVPELVRLKQLIHDSGPRFDGLLLTLLDASGQVPAMRVEAHLDRMLELDPTLWTHPNQVMERPFSDAAELLEACRLRLEGTAEEVDRRRLEAVAEKLRTAVRIEESAQKRRGLSR